MGLDMIRQFNWLDIFVVILLFRTGYIAIKNGLPKEVFKFLGTVASIYLSLHYYGILSDFIRNSFFTKKVSLEFLDFLSFVVLAILGHLVFVLLRSVFYRFIKMEAVPNLTRSGGLVLGILRGFLLIGLIIFMLAISSIGYLKNSVNHSYFGKRFFKIAPNTYSWIWNSITSKFMVNEKFNDYIWEIQEDSTKK